MIEIKIQEHMVTKCWNYCVNHFPPDVWGMKFGMGPNGATMAFNNPEDATVFRLMFSL